MPGVLLVCATPIGNLADVTSRVLDALRDVDIIAAEDTRVTHKLLARYAIDTPLERYDEHTAEARTPALVDRLLSGGRVALVSDAGMPGISDPGQRLVDAAISAGVRVEVLPGPSAIITALVASGLPTHAFYFGGFLPRKAGERARLLRSLEALDATLLFYESPRRTAAALASIAAEYPGRLAAVARELTKMYEEVVRGEVGELATAMAERELKGEIVIVVGPPVTTTRPLPSADEMRAGVAELLHSGVSRSEAVKRYAKENGLPRNAVYEAVHASP